MRPKILAMKRLTSAEEAEAMSMPYRELDPDAIVHYPDVEEDRAAPCRSYVVCVPIPDDAAFVGIIAAPAPSQAPTIDELKRAAHAVIYG
jgi:hypothetical protein